MNEAFPQQVDGPDEVMQQAAQTARARIEGNADPLGLVRAKQEQFEAEEHDRVMQEEAVARAAELRAERARQERLDQERLAEEMVPSDEEIQRRDARESRIAEMNRWANTTGAIAEKKAQLAADNERRLKDDVAAAEFPDVLQDSVDRYSSRNREISREGVVTDSLPGSTSRDGHLRSGGHHSIIDDKGTTRSTINGIEESNRSPQHIRDDSLPHGKYNNPNIPTFR